MDKLLITKQELLNSLKQNSLDSNSDILKALQIAYDVHKDQIRDSGNSYLEEHIYPLTLQTFLRHKNHPDLTRMLVVCILHDVIEDGNIETDFLSKTFNNTIQDDVLALTKDRVTLTQRPTQEWLYEQTERAIGKVKIAGEISQIVRIEDRLQNLQSSLNMNISKKEKYARMVKETEDLYMPLAEKLNSEYAYKTLLEDQVDKIKKVLNSN